MADALLEEAPQNYVRVVAHWLVHGHDLEEAPTCTGSELIVALVAAAAAYRAQTTGAPVPSWANGREVSRFWHPGEDVFFGYSLAHSPQPFLLRGLVVEEDSLASV